ncbi:leucine-rich repeat domain-containing protein [Flavobacterium luteum]|uniref:Leucine-rich repeat domain-containing protein n=1 Tax=Flavobacterium luteum TaxID=2026654 RepID=A0A7J5AGB4_9FLAO|nr:leucine-rich repeat domain-containing protein [Flavobacterium luteum]KAB1156550.1 leucine-rich repeat domain-containing protein [Flavobacterium luteum]
MITETIDGFKVLEHNDYKSLFMDSSRIDDCINFLFKNNIRKISINYYQGFKTNNLDFLLKIKDFIEGISISGDKFDYSVLNKMIKLKTLQYSDDKNNVINLSNFPDLETLSCDFTLNLKGLESCVNLKKLILSKFNPKVKDLSNFPIFENLTELYLFQTNIISLKGIDRLNNLKKLQLYSGNKLESISDLNYLSNGLEEIEIEKCKKIKDYEVLGNLKLIKRLLILDSNEIPTISFIKNLNNLEFFSFGGTNVVDGDLSYCENINYVGFDNKRHYSHKFEYFKNRKAR